MPERDHERERLEAVCDLLRMTQRPLMASAVRLQYEAFRYFSGEHSAEVRRELLNEIEHWVASDE